MPNAVPGDIGTGALPRTGTLTWQQVYTYAVEGGFTAGQEALVATAVAMAESSGRTGVVNKSGNTGLWQIGPAGTKNDAGVGLSSAALKDPLTNARAAHTIYVRAGHSFAKDWAVWKSGAAGRELAKILGAGGLGAAVTGATGAIGDAGSLAGQETGSMLQATGGALADQVQSMQGGVLGQLGTILSWVTTPAKWLRVAYVVGGGVLLVAGVNQMARPITAPVVKGAAKVAKVVK